MLPLVTIISFILIIWMWRFRFSHKWCRVGMAVFVAALCVYGADKELGGGINRVMVSGLRALANVGGRCFSAVEQLLGYTLTDKKEDETHDLTKPNGADMAEAIAARGAFEDSVMVSDCLLVRTDGTLEKDETIFNVRPGMYGFLPGWRWEEYGASRIWSNTNGESGVVTWEGALEARLTNSIVSFQAEFYKNGDVAYRYSPVVGTNSVGIVRGEEELILGVATNTTSLYFAYIGDLGNGTGDYDGDYLSNWEELFLTKTNPRVSDTDGDGEDDAREFAFKPNDFELDCDDDGLLDYDEVGGVRDDCPFLWYDTTNGTNLLSGIGGDINDRLFTLHLSEGLKFDGIVHTNIVVDVNGLVYLPFPTNAYGVTVSHPDNHDLKIWNGNGGHIAVAAYWCDLECKITPNSKIMFLEDKDSQVTVIEYRDISIHGSYFHETATFQVIFPYDNSNNIYVSYGDCTSIFLALLPTIGIQNSRPRKRWRPNLFYDITYSHGQVDAFPGQSTLEFHLGAWTDPFNADTDKDQLSDYEEVEVYHTDPLKHDTDGDGLSDYKEAKEFGTSPTRNDSDNDGLPDNWEMQFGLNPTSAIENDGAQGDFDDDGVINKEEYRLMTNPANQDTDGDGLNDGEEYSWIEYGSNPLLFDMTDATPVADYNKYSYIDGKTFVEPLPFNIQLSGLHCTNVAISVNGIVQFLDKFNKGSIPNLSGNNQNLETYTLASEYIAVAAFWDDLYMQKTQNSQIYIKEIFTNGMDYCVIEYRNIRHYNDRNTSTTPSSFQIIIPNDNSNSIIVQYLSLSGSLNGESATIGIEHEAGGTTLQVGYNKLKSVLSNDVIIYHFGTGSSPIKTDTDDDGLSDEIEVRIKTAAWSSDTDRDGLPDEWEYRHGLNPLSGIGNNGKDGDPDGDGLINMLEFENNSNPQISDTDGDSIPDLYETGGVAITTFPWLPLTNTVDITSQFGNLDAAVTSFILTEPLKVQSCNLEKIIIDLNGLVYLCPSSYNSAISPQNSMSHIENLRIPCSAVIIAPYLNNMRISQEEPYSKISVGEGMFASNRYCVVEFSNMKRIPTQGDLTNSISFQLSIPYAETNEFYVSFSDDSSVALNGEIASVGFQSFDGRQKHSYCYNQIEKVYPGLSLKFVTGTLTHPNYADSDEDGLSDYEEICIQADPRSYDTDGDRFPDGWEVLNGLNPFVNNETDNNLDNDLLADYDGDGLSNFDEYLNNTSPCSTDTDGDGIYDGEEVFNSSNPCDSSDGGQCPAWGALKEFTFDIFGDYAAWEMTVKGEGPKDYRTFRISNDTPGESTISTNNLYSGNTYTVTMKWLRDIYDEEKYWYCWKAQICGLPRKNTFNDYSTQRIKDVAEIIDGNGWIAENRSGLLSNHIHQNSNFGGNMVRGRQSTIYVLDGALVPDYDRVKGIDDDDIGKAKNGRMLHFWINDDSDSGLETGRVSEKSENDIPGALSGIGEIDGRMPNYHSGNVDGFCDLLDFTLLWIDLSYILDNVPEDISLTYRLRQQNSGINVVWTSLNRADGAKFLTEETSNCGENLSEAAYCATTTAIRSRGTKLPNKFIEQMKENPQKGVVLIEGANETYSPLVLEVYHKSKRIFSKELHLGISPVEDMYRWVNLRHLIDGEETRATDISTPLNLTDWETKDSNIFFLHGFNVTEDEARGWNAEIFKRLWQSGSNARYWAVTWNSDEHFPNAIYYHKNVYNAFLTAPHLASFVNANGTGAKVIMGHSLGNMVIASAIQDHGMDVSKFFMFNAAIPSEAFNPNLFDDSASNPLVHDEWRAYTNITWSAKWHELFPATDDRSKLTWKNRFKDVVPKAYNYYSSGDEVFELYNGTPSVIEGLLSYPYVGHYSWHIQETHKGCWGIAGTSWSGWSFREGAEFIYNPELQTFFPFSYRLYSSDEANSLSKPFLTTNTVFNLYPSSMSTNQISQIEIDEHLAKGIPALSRAVGSVSMNEDPNSNVNLQNIKFRPHDWWRTAGNLINRWLHSDIKDVAYFYIYPVFTKMNIDGDLK